MWDVGYGMWDVGCGIFVIRHSPFPISYSPFATRHSQQYPQEEGHQKGQGGFVVEHRAGQAEAGDEGNDSSGTQGQQPDSLPDAPLKRGREVILYAFSTSRPRSSVFGHFRQRGK
jgi:general stress protein YciG